MTKFGKSKKNQTIWFAIPDHLFWQFQGKTKEGATLKDLKIQSVLRHGK
jgi:hypothetical protein